MKLCSKKRKSKAFSLFIILAMLASIFSINAIAEDSQPDDKGNNTAYINEKSAKWLDEKNFLAELTLSVNGEQVLSPLDVVICLDRSGSMDMNYIQGSNFNGTHIASCPCLYQEHFYYTPEIYNVTVPAGTSEDTIIKNSDGTITVYNAEIAYVLDYIANNPDKFPDNVSIAALYDKLNGSTSERSAALSTMKTSGYETANAITRIILTEGVPATAFSPWVTLNTSEKRHLYYELNNDDGSVDLAMYHFRTDESGEPVRISKWVTNDIRKGDSFGVWDHADEDQDCYDRWIEAKQAVEDFSLKLIEAHDDNNVALVPFSIRDSTMLNTLSESGSYKNLRSWLNVQNDEYGYFEDGITVKNGVYDSKVYWTRDITDISYTGDETGKIGMLQRLFTTFNTDYMYALSMAYNMLQARSPHAKATKQAVVVFLSDGKPYNSTNTTYVSAQSGPITSFANLTANITAITDAIKSTETTYHSMWSYVSGNYQRHDVNLDCLIKDDDNKIIGTRGQGAQMVTIGYMLDAPANADGIERLKNMASNAECYINIPARREGSSAGYLSDMLLKAAIFPGGRESVLYDKISKYFYIPIDEGGDGKTLILPDGTTSVLPVGVRVEGTIAEGQTLVWEIGEIYEYAKDLSIKIPLVLRKEYREVSVVTDYPTNEDEEDDPGAELEYTDPDGIRRTHKKKTPILRIKPKDSPKVSPSPLPEIIVTPPPSQPPEESAQPEESAEPAESPEIEVSPEPSFEPGVSPPGYIPGGNDPQTPPAPSLPDNNLIPSDDNTFIELDDDGVPLGTWHWDDEQDTWIFEPLTPLDEFTPPSTRDSNTIYTYGALFVLSALSVIFILSTRQKKRVRN